MPKYYDFIYTAEQAKAICEGSVAARNKFFSDNYQAIRRMCTRYYREVYKRNGYSGGLETDDFVNQLYLDLPYLNWENPALLTHTMRKRSLYHCRFGGLCYLMTSNSKVLKNASYKPLRDSESIYGVGEDGKEFFKPDKMYFEPSPEEKLDEEQREDKILEFVSSFLTPKQTEICKLVLEGYSPTKAAELLKLGGSVRVRMVKSLRQHYFEIKEFLARELDYLASPSYDRIALTYICGA
ncbi:MAG: sigma-70 family RNA polymerase sigma factor [Clostridia bacterium]|nr:sigma-70 family RNA polymerase sigma factor [Clostridia bacterium]